MKALRSLLFVPGNRANMLERASGLRPDAFIPDMEDSVPADEKHNARAVTASFLPRLRETGALVIPRVNSLDTGLIADDLAAVVGPDINGISVGKIQSAADIERVSGIIEELECAAGVEAGSVLVIPWIETALAIVNAYEICASSPRVVAVAFGAEDFTNDMAIERTQDGDEVDYPRKVICIAARAAGVLALDTPFFGFRDPDGLRENSPAGQALRLQGQVRDSPSSD